MDLRWIDRSLIGSALSAAAALAVIPASAQDLPVGEASFPDVEEPARETRELVPDPEPPTPPPPAVAPAVQPSAATAAPETAPAKTPAPHVLAPQPEAAPSPPANDDPPRRLTLSPMADAEPTIRDEPSSTRRDGRQGLFGPFRIGPMFGAGLPSLVSVGGVVKLDGLLGFGVTYGTLPEVGIPMTEASIGLTSLEADVRIYPLRSGFFLGAAMGRQWVQGVIVDDLTSLNGRMQTTYVTPMLGILHTWPVGFSIGFELGVQIPIQRSQAEITDDRGLLATAGLEDDLQSVMEAVGQSPLPVVKLLRIGWLL